MIASVSGWDARARNSRIRHGAQHGARLWKHCGGSLAQCFPDCGV